MVDLLDLDSGTNTDDLSERIILEIGENLLAKKHKALIVDCLDKLKKRCESDCTRKFSSYRMLRSHAMPITDVTATRDGTKYDTIFWHCFFRLKSAGLAKMNRYFEGALRPVMTGHVKFGILQRVEKSCRWLTIRTLCVVCP